MNGSKEGRVIYNMGEITRNYLYTVDLNKPLMRQNCGILLAEGDSNGDCFSFTLMRGGTVVNPGKNAAVTAFFIRQDRNTVYITGENTNITNNRVSVTLPESCYASGRFSIAVKVEIDGEKTTVAILDGHVRTTQTDTWVDPGTAVPSLKELYEQIKAIEDDVAKKVQLKPEFANDISKCTDTSKLYVLPDGYIYAYMYDGCNSPNFTNLADPASSEWLTGQRINSSGVLTAYTGSDAELLKLTNLIPIADVQDVHIKGIDLFDGTVANGNNYNRVYWYDADKNRLLTQNLAGGEMKAEVYEQSADYDSDVTIIHVDDCTAYYGALQNGAAQYIRFGGLRTVETDADIAITCDQNITYSTGGYAWRNTGHVFVSADYEDRIVALETEAESQAERLTELEKGFSQEDTSALPDYWTDAVDVAVSKVKAVQGAGGKDVVNFVWLSDLHYSPGDVYTRNIGHLCAEMMERCNIPVTIMNGDTLTAGVLESDGDVLNTLDGAMNLLAPIGTDRLLLVRGNHDDVYGSYADANYYVNKVAPAKIWDKLHRPQAMDFRRVFGGDGTYFYLDNVPQKVRFVCMNSHFYEGEAITSGTEKIMTTCFGIEQLEWLENVALAVASDWRVIITTHVPVNNLYYLEQYSDGAAFCNIIDTTTADVVAIFSGHCHADTVYTSGSRCPNITITCAGNTPYDATEATRTPGTSTETAIDVVSINMNTREINLVRLGVGSDRSYTY